MATSAETAYQNALIARENERKARVAAATSGQASAKSAWGQAAKSSPIKTGYAPLGFGLPGITASPAATAKKPITMSLWDQSKSTTVTLPNSNTIQNAGGSTTNTQRGTDQVSPTGGVASPTSTLASYSQASVGESAAVSSPTSSLGGMYTSSGTFNPDYTPRSEDEAFTSGVDEYTKKKWLANYYKSKGIPFDPNNLPATWDEEAKQFLSQQDSDKSLLESQIAAAKDKSKKQAASQQAASDVSLASSREGVSSLSNVAAAKDIKLQIGTQYREAFDTWDQQKRSLEQLQKDQQREYIAGREDQIRSQMVAVQEAEAAVVEAENKQREQTMSVLELLQKDNALANMDQESLEFLQNGLPGVPQGVVDALSTAATRNVKTEAEKAKWDLQKGALDTFQGLASEGIQLSDTMILQMAKQTGLPVDSLMQFNVNAQEVMNDKTLDQTQKAAEIQKLGYELDQMSRGIFTQAQQNIDGLVTLYNQGASAEVIAAYKSAAGITDVNDPMYQMDLAYKSAQTNKARMDAYVAAIDAGLNPGAVIPGNSGKYKVYIDENGQYQISAQDGAKGGQCGRFANDVFGAKVFADLYSQKMTKTDPSIGFGAGQTPPTPGMAFVMPITGNKWGHVGIFLGVDGNNALVKDSNWGNDEIIRTHTIPLSQITGYARPPNAQVIGASGGTTGMSDSEILQKYEEAGKVFTTPAEARKAITLARQSGFVPGGKSGLSDKVKTGIDKIAGDFRNEQIVKDYNVAKSGYAYVQSIPNNTENPADDIGLIYALAKAFDPNSVVREGEYATVQKYNQSWASSFGFDAARTFSNTKFLTEQSIQNIKDAIKAKYETQKQSYEQLEKSYVDTIQNYYPEIEDASKYIIQYDSGEGTADASQEWSFFGIKFPSAGSEEKTNYTDYYNNLNYGYANY